MHMSLCITLLQCATTIKNETEHFILPLKIFDCVKSIENKTQHFQLTRRTITRHTQ